MATLKTKCPQCGKDAKLKYETPFGKKFMRVYTCGHTVFTDEAAPLQASDESPEPTTNEVAEVIESYELAFSEEKAVDEFETDGGGQQVHFKDPSLFSLNREKEAYEYQVKGIRFI